GAGGRVCGTRRGARGAPPGSAPRHSRSLDAMEPAAARIEPAELAPRRALAREEAPRANGNPRAEPVRARSDITGMGAPPIPARRAEAPALSPAQIAGGGRTGWLSQLLTRPSPQAEAPAPRHAPP